jgi:hypothetical protein
MSALHMFLPASEPARSEALAQLLKTHHVPRHLVRGTAPKKQAEHDAVLLAGAAQQQQEQSAPAPVIADAGMQRT